MMRLSTGTAPSPAMTTSRGTCASPRSSSQTTPRQAGPQTWGKVNNKEPNEIISITEIYEKRALTLAHPSILLGLRDVDVRESPQRFVSSTQSSPSKVISWFVKLDIKQILII